MLENNHLLITTIHHKYIRRVIIIQRLQELRKDEQQQEEDHISRRQSHQGQERDIERVRPNITRKALQGSSRNSNKIKHINAKISVS